MKASASPAVLTAFVFLTLGTAFAQDTLVLSNNQRREGEILAVTDGRVRFKVGQAETTIPLDQIASAKMEPPKDFQLALESWQSGNAAQTLQKLQPLVAKFRGLPAPWAERASALLGAVLLENGDVPGAEAAFADFQQTYPGAEGLAQLGLARLAIEKKDFDSASEKLAPIVEAARKTKLAESGKNAEYGQALYLMGLVLEEQGRLPEALDSYLLTVTVFYEDSAIAAKAGTRAELLSGEKKVVVP